ncbi:peptidylprolyl isomerase [Denitrobaculum tricleocarpae]|uniref:Parvulin-like PPIase n=1 Tax=Denitrobaculum tricleocarpae TaxID=2591009 RepID=A0A545T7P5_9PROT|nr:peptidylprolyl isomerase [Denitrobaculum tricleocarpae]TQV73240.1 peptidylprolyl isomerase [Denitrobaculum tricleocarpae]
MTRPYDRSPSRQRLPHQSAMAAFLGLCALAVPLRLQTLADGVGLNVRVVSLAQAESDLAPSNAESLPNLEYSAESDIPGSGAIPKSGSSVPAGRASPLVIEPIAPPAGYVGNAVSKPGGAADVDVLTLGSAMQEMIRRNPVVAEVDGEEIRWKDVIESAGDLPEEYQSRLESVFPALLDRLIDLKLLANAAREKDLDDDKDLRRRVKSYEDILLRDAYMAQTVAPDIAEADVRARYFEVLRANAGMTERHLRHVVVESREEALAVVQSLNDGLDFSELAKNYSIGGSAADGGDLGFMRRDSLAPDFAAAAFDLTVGSYSSRPLRTEFGWHVIKVEAERKASLPVYEELAPKLRDELARERIGAVLKKLRADADLDLFPEN